MQVKKSIDIIDNAYKNTPIRRVSYNKYLALNREPTSDQRIASLRPKKIIKSKQLYKPEHSNFLFKTQPLQSTDFNYMHDKNSIKERSSPLLVKNLEGLRKIHSIKIPQYSVKKEEKSVLLNLSCRRPLTMSGNHTVTIHKDKHLQILKHVNKAIGDSDIDILPKRRGSMCFTETMSKTEKQNIAAAYFVINKRERVLPFLQSNNPDCTPISSIKSAEYDFSWFNQDDRTKSGIIK